MLTSNHVIYATASSFNPPIYYDDDGISASNVEMDPTGDAIQDKSSMDFDEPTEDSNSSEPGIEIN